MYEGKVNDWRKFTFQQHLLQLENDVFIFKIPKIRKVEPRVTSDLIEKLINATNKNTTMHMNTYTMLHASTKYTHTL